MAGGLPSTLSMTKIPCRHETEPTPNINLEKPALQSNQPLMGKSHDQGSAAQIDTISNCSFYLITVAFVIANFMVALDGSILATAIPTITSDFNSLNDISWYGTAYLFTQMACGPAFGKIYTHFNGKPAYMATLLIFEIGSIICAAAPNSVSLIIGRAVAGIGAAGVQCGCLTLFAQIVPLQKRPLGMALITCVYGIADVLGPTVGGFLTNNQRLTWRFCFWINLPFGALAAVLSFFVIKPPKIIVRENSLWQKLQKLDLLGIVPLTLALISLTMAMQIAASNSSWADYRIWIWFSAFAICGCVFVAWQIRAKDDATIPARIISQRTVSISCLFMTVLSMAVYIHVYYLPIYFQAAKAQSAAESGVDVLAYAISITIFTVISGFIMTTYRYYVPLMWVGSAILIPGSVLLYTLDTESSVGKYIGYQIIAGVGFGLAFQVPFVAVQVVVAPSDLPVALALVVFFRSLGGSLGIDIAQLIFSKSLSRHLEDVPGIDVAAIIAMGAGNISNSAEPPAVALIRDSYNGAVMETFILPIVAAGLGLVSSGFIERKRIPAKG